MLRWRLPINTYRQISSSCANGKLDVARDDGDVLVVPGGVARDPSSRFFECMVEHLRRRFRLDTHPATIMFRLLPLQYARRSSFWCWCRT